MGRQRTPAIHGLDLFLNASVSREQLLLLRGRYGCVAYDLATANGNFHQGKRIRALVLDEEGGEIVLGKASSVTMAWRAVGA